MRHGQLASAFVLAVSLPTLLAAGQAVPQRAVTSPVQKWTLTRTPEGHPDLQGIWDFRTVTPLERPAEFAGKAVLTEQEAAEYERRTVAARDADANRDKAGSGAVTNGTSITADLALAYNDFWYDRGTRVIGTRRTSLIVDPPDGRIPPITEAAKKRYAAIDQARERPALGPEDRSVGERCILGFNSGPPMIPGGYNMYVQIVQSPGYVVIMNEMVHSARIVPLDGRPHGTVRSLVGTSRGRWEGHTLVVETRNFLNETSLRGSSPTLQLTERFTRADAQTLLYEFTVNDPTTWTRPWTAQVPMRRTDEQIFEYACHEANYGMSNLLKGARFGEAQAAGATRPK